MSWFFIFFDEEMAPGARPVPRRLGQREEPKDRGPDVLTLLAYRATA